MVQHLSTVQWYSTHVCSTVVQHLCVQWATQSTNFETQVSLLRHYLKVCEVKLQLCNTRCSWGPKLSVTHACGRSGFRCFQHWIPWIHFIIVMFENNKLGLQNVLLMGGGNNYSSGLFQLLPGVYCDWKLSWLLECQHMFGNWYWSVILASDICQWYWPVILVSDIG